MKKFADVSLFLLRISMGWMFLYAGVTKLMDPAWSAKGYLLGAKTLKGLFGWLASDTMLPLVNFLNEWGLTLLGVALILGIFIRLSSILGAALMVLYYLPILDGLKPNAHAFVVDEHVIYFFALLVLMAFNAGRVWGLDPWCSQLPICKKYLKSLH